MGTRCQGRVVIVTGAGRGIGRAHALAFAREGYKNTTVNVRDLSETLAYPGFWRLAMRYWKIGADEMWRSFSKRAFVRALQRLTG